MKLEAVVLAAGRASRFGSQKLLADCSGIPLIARTVSTVLSAFGKGIAILTGHQGELVRDAVEKFVGGDGSDQGTGVLRCWQVPGELIGRQSSLPAFLEAVLANRSSWEFPDDGILVCLGDMPGVRKETMVLLSKTGRAAGPRSVVVPYHRGERGNPVWLGREVAAMISLHPEKPVREAIAEFGPEPIAVEVQDPGILEDIDMKEHLGEWKGSWMNPASMKVVVRGAGDLGSGIVYRLFNSGFGVVAIDLPQPTAVRRKVAFCEAMRDGEITVEGVRAVRVGSIEDAGRFIGNFVPLAACEGGSFPGWANPDVLIDARMLKAPGVSSIDEASLVIGIGPGFVAGSDCHLVVETMRGPELGRIIRSGSARPDTGIPGLLGGETSRRLLRAPAAGRFEGLLKIGDLVEAGETVGFIHVDGDGGTEEIKSIVPGKIRGLLGNGTKTDGGMKIGDVDPRGTEVGEEKISDKALAIGGSILEAILSWHCGPRQGSLTQASRFTL